METNCLAQFSCRGRSLVMYPLTSTVEYRLSLHIKNSSSETERSNVFNENIYMRLFYELWEKYQIKTVLNKSINYNFIILLFLD